MKAYQNNSYFLYLVNNYLHRPAGYICIIVYIAYLSLILLFVPLIIHTSPLFIWTNQNFNMGIFNIILIAIICSVQAVIIFREGIDDGSELIIAAKPIRRSRYLFIKFGLFIIIVIFTTILSMVLSCFILCWGQQTIFNPTGVTNDQFYSLFLSLLIGNVICMAIFGSIAILLSMISGKIMIMVGTISISIVLALFNFLIPTIAKSPVKTLSDDYGLNIYTRFYSTGNQLTNSSDEVLKNGAYITVVNDNTAEYWKKVTKNSGLNVANYFDFGGQLSTLFNLFELQQNTLEVAEEGTIGQFSNFSYSMNEDDKVYNQKNINSNSIPSFSFHLQERDGLTKVLVDLKAISSSIYSHDKNFYGVKEDAIFYANYEKIKMPQSFANKLGISNSFTLNDVKLTDDQKKWCANYENTNTTLFNVLCNDYENLNSKNLLLKIFDVQNNFSKRYYDNKEFNDLPPADKLLIIAKIKNYLLDANSLYLTEEIKINPTMTENEIIDLFAKNKQFKNNENFIMEYVNSQKYSNDWSIEIDGFDSNISVDMYSMMLMWNEFNNFYEYQIKKYLNDSTIVMAWGVVAIIIYSIGIAVYSKSDIK